MRELRAAFVLTLLLPVGPMVPPAVHAQQSSAVPIAITLIQRVDVFQKASQTYTLTKAPASTTTALVFVNGILMCSVCGNDYTLTGTTLTFTGQQTAAMDSPVIQVWYWSATN
jgi:hypothetical protein